MNKSMISIFKNVNVMVYRTIAAYQTLYQSSVTFGTRKQLQAEQGQQDAKVEIKVHDHFFFKQTSKRFEKTREK